MNHKGLVDELKASLSGEDVGVFYRANESSLPVEIDRIISNVYTASTSVRSVQHPRGEILNKYYWCQIVRSCLKSFWWQATSRGQNWQKERLRLLWRFLHLRPWGVDPCMGRVDCKQRAFAWKDWKICFWLSWGRVYLAKGKAWKDNEVYLNFMETSSNVVYTGPLFRVQDLGYIIQQPGGLSIKQIVKTVPWYPSLTTKTAVGFTNVSSLDHLLKIIGFTLSIVWWGTK